MLCQHLLWCEGFVLACSLGVLWPKTLIGPVECVKKALWVAVLRPLALPEHSHKGGTGHLGRHILWSLSQRQSRKRTRARSHSAFRCGTSDKVLPLSKLRFGPAGSTAGMVCSLSVYPVCEPLSFFMCAGTCWAALLWEPGL